MDTSTICCPSGLFILPLIKIGSEFPVHIYQYIDISRDLIHDMVYHRLAPVGQQGLGLLNGKGIKPGAETAGKDQAFHIPD
jgi:hypothetical protein